MTVAGVNWRWLFWLLTIFVSGSFFLNHSVISVLCRYLSLHIKPDALAAQLVPPVFLAWH